MALAYNTNGYIPAGYGMLKKGVEDLPPIDVDIRVGFRQPISSVLSTIESLNGHGIYCSIDEEKDRAVRQLFNFHPAIAHQITILHRVSSSDFKAIPERIKDKVLDWACKLEAVGVLGENMSFSKEEKDRSTPVVFNLDGCNVGQLTNSGMNQKG